MSDLAQIFAGAAGPSNAGVTVTDTLDDAFRSHRAAQVKSSGVTQAGKKKAKGMSREVYNLLGANAIPPMVRTVPLVVSFYGSSCHYRVLWCRGLGSGA